MQILAVDAPRGWCVLEVPRIGPASALALGTLDEGREADELDERLQRWTPKLVCIETPLEPYIGGRGAEGGEGQRRAVVMSLMRVARLGGRLEERAIVRGYRVLVQDAAHVRRALGVRPDDAAVKAYVRARVPNWPKVSNTHHRDAGMAAIWAAGQAAR